MKVYLYAVYLYGSPLLFNLIICQVLYDFTLGGFKHWLFIFYTILHCRDHTGYKCVLCLLLFQTAVVSCSVVVFTLFTTELFRSPFMYYTLVVAVAGFISLPTLVFYFHRDFITWLFYYICQDTVKVIDAVKYLFFSFQLFQILAWRIF